ncbi:Deoxyuridine 5'-triphosphate nucleotidohydrolase [Paraconexibacter sp. AEG42_29]|uniref:Deoxyuridine 5'-triphosphate nucleotidohydrolase n=1 Tax=Paraconexibacter sp. AEG42_29 TaxID=2997339 RepID=A0AAU7AVT0_9ACTN
MTDAEAAGAGGAAAVPADELRIQRLDPRATLPERAHPGDAGLDLCALDGGTLGPGARELVPTGLAIALPAGHAALVVPRSGLAARHGVTLVNTPGLIDEGYRGELRVLLLNSDREATFDWSAGDRIAQLVLIAVAAPPVVEADSLDDTQRGSGGFGSSGR